MYLRDGSLVRPDLRTPSRRMLMSLNLGPSWWELPLIITRGQERRSITPACEGHSSSFSQSDSDPSKYPMWLRKQKARERSINVCQTFLLLTAPDQKRLWICAHSPIGVSKRTKRRQHQASILRKMQESGVQFISNTINCQKKAFSPH